MGWFLKEQHLEQKLKVVMISGFTTARNVVALQYPLEECVRALRAVCDEVVIGYDPYTEDGTHEIAVKLAEDLDLVLFESKWDMENRDAGTEIGVQADLTLAKCKFPWTLYCQLDEAIHEDDRDLLHALVASPGDVTGFSFVRPYFWQNLHTIRKDWSPEVIRLTKQGTHVFSVLDGHSCKTMEGRVEKSNLWMYHYSRLGDPQAISQRVRTLDGLFHAEETLIPREELPNYDWGTRRWDNFSRVEKPPEVQAEFLAYRGAHPLPFAERYQEFE
jgi:hypothetical protein